MPYKPLTHLPHEACFVAYFHFSEAAYIKLLDTKGLLSFHDDSVSQWASVRNNIRYVHPAGISCQFEQVTTTSRGMSNDGDVPFQPPDRL
jgi:hypothetical protein